MTAADALEFGAAKLPRRRGIPDPRREANWLLARAWGVEEITLRLHPERGVPAEVETRYRGWLERRAAGEPAHHLTGDCEFWGRTFEVSPAVLVPRPETELVIQVALDLPLSPTAQVLDVGTGSGCIAITLAAERPKWRVAAVDTSPRALEVARTNAARNSVDINFHEADLTTTVEPPWDLVVANLPYIPTGDLEGLPLEVHHDPASALDGGPDGLDLVRRLIEDLPRLLRPCGGAILELYEDQADTVVELASAAGLGVARRIKDPGGCERVVVLQPR
jgi:release factor glutamine methyltransferase